MTEPVELWPDLPLPHRLALAHAPADQKPAVGAALALDARLARFVAQAHEPLVAQLRLAWWREQLAKAQGERARGDAILDGLSATWGAQAASLTGLVDGWEQLLGEPPLSVEAISEFLTARGTMFGHLAAIADAPEHETEADRAGRLWGVADLLAQIGADETERARLLDGAASADTLRSAQPIRLPRRLPHLTILGMLGRASVMRGGVPMLQRRSDFLLVTRIGLLGF